MAQPRTRGGRRCLSLGIALATVALGELNVIAPVVSMFFLISYGLLNYATYFEARGADPSFRPRFRYFNKWASLGGAIGCLGVMLAINPIAGGAAVLAMLGIRAYLQKTERPDRFSDASRSFYFQRVRESIGQSGADRSPRNWRPQVLAFSAEPRRRARLLRFASWMEGGTGLTAVVQIVVGHGAVKRREREEQDELLQREISELDLEVYGTGDPGARRHGSSPRHRAVLWAWPDSGQHRSVWVAGDRQLLDTSRAISRRCARCTGSASTS